MTITLKSNTFPRPVQTTTPVPDGWHIWDCGELPLGVMRKANRHSIDQAISAITEKDHNLRAHPYLEAGLFAAVPDDEMRAFLQMTPWLLADVEHDVAVWWLEELPDHIACSTPGGAQETPHSQLEGVVSGRWPVNSHTIGSWRKKGTRNRVLAVRLSEVIAHFSKIEAAPVVLPCTAPNILDGLHAVKLAACFDENGAKTLRNEDAAMALKASNDWSEALRVRQRLAREEEKRKAPSVVVQPMFDPWD